MTIADTLGVGGIMRALRLNGKLGTSMGLTPVRLLLEARGELSGVYGP